MKSVNARLADRSVKSPQFEHARSVERSESGYARLALLSAFPLPRTGAFTDLLAAIDDTDVGTTPPEKRTPKNKGIERKRRGEG